MQYTDEQRVREASKITVIGMAGNILLTGLKIVAGIVGRSSAMVADGFHSLSDLVTDVVLLFGVHMGSKPADEDHPYGHGRFETFATLIIAFVLLLTALGIFYEGASSIYKVIRGEVLPRPGYIAFIMAIVSIIAKEIMYRYTLSVGRKIGSDAVVSNAWHHRSDAFSSVATLIGIGGAIFLGSKWTFLDPATAMFVSIFIFIVGLQIIKVAAQELMDRALPLNEIDEIKALCISIAGVLNPHDIKTRKVGYRISIELHINVDKDTPFTLVHDKTLEIERVLKKRFGENIFVSIHAEPI